MPDPAIDAYNAGLRYTEPKGPGVLGKKGKVKFEANPHDPSPPPRRVIDLTQGDQGGIFGMFGNKDEQVSQHAS